MATMMAQIVGVDPAETCYETTQDYTPSALYSPSSTYSVDSTDSEESLGSNVDTTTPYGSNVVNTNLYYDPVYDGNNNQYPYLLSQAYQNDYYDDSEDGNLLKEPQFAFALPCEPGCTCSTYTAVPTFYLYNDVSQVDTSTNDYNTPENLSGSNFSDQPTVPSSSPLLNDSDLPANDYYYYAQNEESPSTIAADTGEGVY